MALSKVRQLKICFESAICLVSSYNPVIQNWRWGHNFSRKVSIDFSQIRGSRLKGEKRKESEPVIFRKLTFLKWKINRVSSYFFFWSLWCRVVWMLTFWGNCDITISFGSTGKHYCWKISYDAPGQTGFFLPSYFEYPVWHHFFPSV